MTKSQLPTEAEIAEFENLRALLGKAYKEFSDTAKKQPIHVVSALRLDMANRVLDPLRPILSIVIDESFLPNLDPHEPPSNSDALYILGQYQGAVEVFTSRFHFIPKDEYNARWTTQEKPGKRR